MRPWYCFFRPNTILIFIREDLRYVRQIGAVMRRRITTDATPVNRFGCILRIRVSLDDVGESLFGTRPVLFHHRRACESHLEIGAKFVLWKISLEAPAFFSVLIRDQNSRCPERIEASEIFWILFDVNFERDKSLVDKG